MSMFDRLFRPIETNRVRHVWLGLAAGIFLLLTTGTAAADTRVLTADGELSELAASPHSSGHLVLWVGGDHVNLPGSSGLYAEAVHLARTTSGSMIAVWLRPSGGKFILETAVWDGRTWSEVHTLDAAGETMRLPERPSVTLARDRAVFVLESEESDGPPVFLDLERHLFHVLWQEDDGRIRYSPLIFDNGHYVGWNETLTLTRAFAEAHADLPPRDLPPQLARLSSVSTDESGRLSLTLTEETYGRIGTLVVDPVSLVMEILGDSVFDSVLDAADVYDPAAPGAIADEMRAEIIYIGSRLELNPSIAEYIADQISRWIESSSSDFGWDFEALANASRLATLDIGRSVYRVTVPSGSGAGDITLLDIGDFLDGNGHRAEFSRLLNLRVAADFQAPESVGTAPLAHASADGQSLALSWLSQDSGTLSWIENRGGGWSGVKSLALTESLDADAARQLVTSSIR